MDEIDTAASMSAVRDAAGCEGREERQQPPIVVVDRVRQRAVLDFEDAEDAVAESGGRTVEPDGGRMKFIRHIPTGLVFEVLSETDTTIMLRGIKSGVVREVSHQHLQEKGGFTEVRFVNGEFVEAAA